MICKQILLAAALVLAPSLAAGQVTHGQEHEAGLSGSQVFESQYYFFDSDQNNALARFFWVQGVLTRVELGLGPTFKRGSFTVKPTLGATTDKELMAAVLVEDKVRDHRIIYIADAKFAKGTTVSSLYQKAWLGLDAKNVWQARYEQLTIAREVTFVRLGVEYQFQLPTKTPTHFYVVPFYEVKASEWSILGGFRFFGRKLG